MGQVEDDEGFRGNETAIGGTVGFPSIIAMKAAWHPAEHGYGLQFEFGRSQPEFKSATSAGGEAIIKADFITSRLELRRLNSFDDNRGYQFLGAAVARTKFEQKDTSFRLSQNLWMATGGYGYEIRSIPGGGVGAEIGLAYVFAGSSGGASIFPIANIYLLAWFHL